MITAGRNGWQILLTSLTFSNHTNVLFWHNKSTKCQSHHLIVLELYAAHTSLTLPNLSFLLFLCFGFEGTVGTQPLSDLQKWRRRSILHLINGITCTDSLDFIMNRMKNTFVTHYKIGSFKNKAAVMLHVIHASCDICCTNCPDTGKNILSGSKT